MNESEKIWKEFLNEVDLKFTSYIPIIQNNTNYVAVIVETRKHEDLLLSIRSTMYYLNEFKSNVKWGLQIFHGSDNKDFIKFITKDWKNVNCENLEVDELTKKQYNDLLMTSDFWKKIKGEKILIFQTDSVLLRHGIDEFLEYDYVGAPWRKSKEGQFIGNGGLSLRTKEVMINICDNYKETEHIWEDIYFIKHLKGQGVPDIEIAKRFSMEDVFSPNPLGVHNPIRHIEPSSLKEVLFKNI
jgi:Protein of unknown function (DUF5672)